MEAELDPTFRTEAQQAEDSRRAKLYAEVTFPVDCAWCVESGHIEGIIESREELGGFDMEAGLPVCHDCMDIAINEMHS